MVAVVLSTSLLLGFSTSQFLGSGIQDSTGSFFCFTWHWQKSLGGTQLAEGLFWMASLALSGEGWKVGHSWGLSWSTYVHSPAWQSQRSQTFYMVPQASWRDRKWKQPIFSILGPETGTVLPPPYSIGLRSHRADPDSRGEGQRSITLFPTRAFIIPQWSYYFLVWLLRISFTFDRILLPGSIKSQLK